MSYPIPDQFFIDSSQGLLISTGITTALACAIVLFRIYARGWVTMSTDGDDYTMWMATVGEATLGEPCPELTVLGFVRPRHGPNHRPSTLRDRSIRRLPTARRSQAEPTPRLHLPTGIHMGAVLHQGVHHVMPPAILAIEGIHLVPPALPRLPHHDRPDIFWSPDAPVSTARNGLGPYRPRHMYAQSDTTSGDCGIQL
jgi:hypothetical protein